MTTDMKLVVLVRQDLKLPKGKLAAQVGHAAVESVFNSEKQKVDEWRSQGQKKVVLKVKDESELMDFLKRAKALKLKACLITDAGRTVLEPGTKTCVGIGPDYEDVIDRLTGKLPMV
jgi:PTH2 family peptidyl-tRNA hydrolase